MKCLSRVAAAIGIFVMLTGCGGGGGRSSGPNVTAVATNRAGTYVLTSLTDDLTNTATNVHQQLTSSASSSPTATGTLKMGSTSWTEILNVDATGSERYYGQYTFSPTTSTSGRFKITNTSFASPRQGSYTITSNTDITLVYDLSTVTTSSGSYFLIETQKWSKVSDSI